MKLAKEMTKNGDTLDQINSMVIKDGQRDLGNDMNLLGSDTRIKGRKIIQGELFNSSRNKGDNKVADTTTTGNPL